MPYYITPPPMNPLSRLLAAIVAVLALVGAFFFGVFVLAFDDLLANMTAESFDPATQPPP